MVLPRITIVTPGRFHSFDLAEQLQRAGRLAAIYTGYPRFKLTNTEVSPESIRSYPWLQTPYMALIRFPWLPNRFFANLAWRVHESLDAFAARTLPDCRLVSALSGSGLRVGREIQGRGGIYVCDRGSTHIQWQQEILDEEYRSMGLHWSGIDRRIIDKEKEEYETADAITVPSTFVQRSFAEKGVDPKKLRLVPYGVNVKRFKRCAPRDKKFRILFVGQLSIRKGLHYLLQAFSKAKIPGSELILVGGATNDTKHILGRYSLDGVTLTGILPRELVAQEMSRASVMILPSIEEGLALVQAQALSCGCPVIASTNTGSEDLFADGCEGFIVPPRDVDALVDRLTRLYEQPEILERMSQAAVERVSGFGGWDRYGALSLRVFDQLIGDRHIE